MRIAMLGDLDGPHTQRWLQALADRGHEMHAISFYKPRAELPGITVHVLSGRESPSTTTNTGPGRAHGLIGHLPQSLLRFVHAARYQRAGLRRTLDAIAPDVFHAHYVVEHGFYGAFAGFHPYVVSAWGSDLFVESHKPLGRLAARYALRHADLITGNDPALVSRAIALGAPRDSTHVVRLGVDSLYLEGPVRSVNLEPPDAAPPTIISDRALEPLYNVDVVVRAFALLQRHLPGARLVIAHDGSERPRLEALARDLSLGDSVRFLGRLEPAVLRDALQSAHVYVSVPTTDSLSRSTMEAMANGAFPIVTDLPSQDGWIEHGINGLRVPIRDVHAPTDAMHEALIDHDRRKRAVAPNRAKVADEGHRAKNMLAMERYYYALAGHPLASSESI